MGEMAAEIERLQSIIDEQQSPAVAVPDNAELHCMEAGEQEPVLWQGKTDFKTHMRFKTLKPSDEEMIRGEFVPLYAHPLQAQAVPEGWQLVPIEPSQHQLHEAYDNHLMEPFSRQSTGHEVAKRIYKTMLSAAIKP